MVQKCLFSQYREQKCLVCNGPWFNTWKSQNYAIILLLLTLMEPLNGTTIVIFNPNRSDLTSNKSITKWPVGDLSYRKIPRKQESTNQSKTNHSIEADCSIEAFLFQRPLSTTRLCWTRKG